MKLSVNVFLISFLCVGVAFGQAFEPLAPVSDLKKAIENGLDVNERVEGETPLETLVMGQDWIVDAQLKAGELLEAGANPNQPAEDGTTPLHWAAISLEGTQGMISLLIEYGGDPNIPDNKGKTPYELAMRYGNFAAVSAIEAASDFRHPRRDVLMKWGLHSLKIRSFLKNRPSSPQDVIEGVSEINSYLVKSGLISAEEKKEHDRRALKRLSECCGEETLKGGDK